MKEIKSFFQNNWKIASAVGLVLVLSIVTVYALNRDGKEQPKPVQETKEVAKEVETKKEAEDKAEKKAKEEADKKAKEGADKKEKMDKLKELESKKEDLNQKLKSASKDEKEKIQKEIDELNKEISESSSKVAETESNKKVKEQTKKTEGEENSKFKDPKPENPKSEPKPVITYGQRTVESKREIAFSTEQVEDPSQNKGTSGVKQEGVKGIEVTTKIIKTKLVDGKYDSDVEVLSSTTKITKQPLNRIEWYGTKEEEPEPKEGRYLEDVAQELGEVLKRTRAEHGLETSYTVTASHGPLWEEYGFTHFGNGNECMAYAGSPETNMKGWMSDGHRESVLSPGATWYVEAYETADGDWYMMIYQ